MCPHSELTENYTWKVELTYGWVSLKRREDLSDLVYLFMRLSHVFIFEKKRKSQNKH